jgi:hypothetical protein
MEERRDCRGIMVGKRDLLRCIGLLEGSQASAWYQDVVEELYSSLAYIMKAKSSCLSMSKRNNGEKFLKSYVARIQEALRLLRKKDNVPAGTILEVEKLVRTAPKFPAS